MTVALLAMLVACSGGGSSAHGAASPDDRDCTAGEPSDDGGVRVDSEAGEVHVLGLGGRFEAGEEVKLVWRITGSGDPTFVAVSPNGERHPPIQGPTPHATSTFDRPGDEWGVFFRFDDPGCWQIEVSRGEVRAEVPVAVV